MKKLLTILLISVYLACAGQTQIVTGTDSYYRWLPYASQRVHQSDSVQLVATILTNGNVSSITWMQTAGTAVKITPMFSTEVGILGQSSFWVSGLSPGNYSFTATATVNGQPFTTVDSFTVAPDMVCPPPRTVTGLQAQLFGVWVTIPITSAKFAFSDGSTQ